MSVETDALPGGAEPVVSYPTADDSPMTTEEAARSLTDARNKAIAQIDKPAESAEEATAEEELPDEGNAGLEEVPGETQEADPEETLPPVEPPRSWTKEAKDRWNTIPREAQEEFARIEQGREREFLRVQQESAEKLKGLTAKEQAAEEARKQYETAKLDTVAALEREQQRDFPDIRTMDDVRLLQKKDPFRFQEWQIHQMSLANAVAEKQAIESRQGQQRQKETQDRKVREHALLIEKAPEYADSKKLSAAQTAAGELFRDKGFTENELSAFGDNPLLDDHRMQLIIADALKYREIQKAPKAVATKTLPPVQRPGTSKPAGSSTATQIQALEKQLSSASGDKAARISADIWRLEKRAKAG